MHGEVVVLDYHSISTLCKIHPYCNTINYYYTCQQDMQYCGHFLLYTNMGTILRVYDVAVQIAGDAPICHGLERIQT